MWSFKCKNINISVIIQEFPTRVHPNPPYTPTARGGINSITLVSQYYEVACIPLPREVGMLVL